MEQKVISIKQIQCNTGQIDGLPANPRQITQERLDLLKKSLTEAPEMLHLRELLVFPHNGKYVVIGGNMRYRAAVELGLKELPCKIIDADTPIDKLREYTIKDNNGYGAYDWDMLANEWDDVPLIDWGVDMPDFGDVSADDYGTEFSLKDGDKEPFQQMTFTLADEQAQFIKMQLEISKRTQDCETFGNTNTNGNALYNIVKLWADAKR